MTQQILTMAGAGCLFVCLLTHFMTLSLHLDYVLGASNVIYVESELEPVNWVLNEGFDRYSLDCKHSGGNGVVYYSPPMFVYLLEK